MNKRYEIIGFWSVLFITLIGIVLRILNSYGIQTVSSTAIIAGIIVLWIAYFLLFRTYCIEWMENISSRHEDVFRTANETFNYLLIAYLILLLLQQFKIFSGVNANYLLAIVIISGVITVLFPTARLEHEKQMGKWDIVIVIFLGIIGGVLVYLKTVTLGWISYVISPIAAVLIILLGFLVYEKDEVEEEIAEPSLKKAVIWFFLILVVASIIVSIFVDVNSALRIVFGSVYVLFLPGFILSMIFFSHGKIDLLERIALSFALSIAVVPLVVFYLNLIGLKINALNVAFVILGICFLGLLGIKLKQRFGK